MGDIRRLAKRPFILALMFVESVAIVSFFLFQSLYWRPGVDLSDGCATTHSLHLASPYSTASHLTLCV